MAKQQRLTAEEKKEITAAVIEQITVKYNLPSNWLTAETKFVESTASRRFADREPEFRKQVRQQLLDKLKKINPVKAQAFEMEIKLRDGGAVDEGIFATAPLPKDRQQFNDFLSGKAEAVSLTGKALVAWAKKNSDRLASSGISYSIEGETVILRNENYLPASLDAEKKEFIVSALQGAPTQATLDAVAAYVVASRELERSDLPAAERKFLESQQQNVYQDIEAGKPRSAKQRAITITYYLEVSARAGRENEVVQKYLKMSRSLMKKSKFLSAIASLNLAGTAFAVSMSDEAGFLDAYLQKARGYVAKGKLEKASRINRLILQYLQLSQLSVAFGDISAEDIGHVVVSLSGFKLFQEKKKFSKNKFLKLMGITYEEFKKKGLAAVLEAFYEKGRGHITRALASIREALALEAKGKDSSKMQDGILSAFQKANKILTEGATLAGLIQAIRRVRGAAVGLRQEGFQGVRGRRARHFLEGRKKEALVFYQRMEGHLMQMFFHRAAAIEEPSLGKIAARFGRAIPSLQREAAAKTNETFKYYNIAANFERYVAARAEASRSAITGSVAILKKMRAQFADIREKTRKNVTATGSATAGKEKMDDYIDLVDAQRDSVKLATGIIATYSPDEVQMQKAGGTLEGMFGKKNPSTSAFDIIDEEVGRLGKEAYAEYRLTLRNVENALTDVPIKGVWYDPVTLAVGGFGARGVLGLGQVAWRALPSAVRFGLSAGATAYGTIELGRGSYAYVKADTEEQEKQALQHLRSGAITLGMGVMGLSSLKFLSPALVTAAEAGTVGVGAFVTREDISRMSRTGKVEPLVLATDVLMFLPAIPIAAKAVSAVRAARPVSEARKLATAVNSALETEKGLQVLESTPVKLFLSRTYAQQEAIIGVLVKAGQHQAALRLNYLRGVAFWRQAGLVTGDTATNLSVAILQERNFENTQAGMMAFYEKLQAEGIIGGVAIAKGHPGADFLGVLSSSINRLAAEGRIVFGKQAVPAGSIKVVDFKFGGKGAFSVTIELPNGARTAVIMKLENLAAEAFGTSLVSDAGIMAPKVMTHVAGKPLTYLTPEGYSGFGLIQHMGETSAVIEGALVRTSSMATMREIGPFIRDNNILSALFRTDALALRRLITRALGYTQTGLMHVGAMDATVLNLPVMLGRIRTAADAKKILGTGRYLFFEEGVTKSLVTQFTPDTLGIVMKAKDGTYSILSVRHAVGRFDCETTALFSAVRAGNTMDFKHTAIRFARDLDPSLKSIDEAFATLGRAFNVKGAYSLRQTSADCVFGSQIWYNHVGSKPEFASNVLRRIAAYNGKPIGLASSGRLPPGVVEQALPYSKQGALSAPAMERIRKWLFSPEGGGALYDNWLRNVAGVTEINYATRMRFWTEKITPFLKTEAINGYHASPMTADGRFLLDAKASQLCFKAMMALGRASQKADGAFSLSIWRDIFRYLKFRPATP